MTDQKYQILLNKYLDKTATAEELKEFFSVTGKSSSEKMVLQALETGWNNFQPKSSPFSSIEEQRALAHVLAKKSRTRPIISPIFLRIAAVFALCFVGIVLWYYMNARNQAGWDSALHSSDATPAISAATLTLSDGKKIYLNAGKNDTLYNLQGLLIRQGSKGELIYEDSGKINSLRGFNTLTTNKGQIFSLRLADGSRIILNSASSVKYPTSFADNAKRAVDFSGEGFFQISKDSEHPFVVKSAIQEVEVLGTVFNINTLKDKNITLTTLIEGSVRVNRKNAGNGTIKLKPGQQSILSRTQIQVLEADSNVAIAWKKGEFVFNDEPLSNILEEVSRWYDVHVVYEDTELRYRKFGGTISRNSNLSRVLRMLELTEDVHFKIEGRRILVTK